MLQLTVVVAGPKSTGVKELWAAETVSDPFFAFCD